MESNKLFKKLQNSKLNLTSEVYFSVSGGGEQMLFPIRLL